MHKYFFDNVAFLLRPWAWVHVGFPIAFVTAAQIECNYGMNQNQA